MIGKNKAIAFRWHKYRYMCGKILIFVKNA